MVSDRRTNYISVNIITTGSAEWIKKGYTLNRYCGFSAINGKSMGRIVDIRVQAPVGPGGGGGV